MPATGQIKGLRSQSTKISSVPLLISHQGYIVDSTGTGITGTLPITFNFWDDSIAGTNPLSLSFPGIILTKGVFSVNLDITSLDLTKQYWLETVVNGQILAPRMRLTSAPYSLAPWETNGTSIYYDGGNVGIGTNNPSASLEVIGHTFSKAPLAVYDSASGSGTGNFTISWLKDVRVDTVLVEKQINNQDFRLKKNGWYRISSQIWFSNLINGAYTMDININNIPYKSVALFVPGTTEAVLSCNIFIKSDGNTLATLRAYSWVGYTFNVDMGINFSQLSIEYVGSE